MHRPDGSKSFFPHDLGGPFSPFHTRVILEAREIEPTEQPRLPEIVFPDPPADLEVG
jgi:hypothetical protein